MIVFPPEFVKIEYPGYFWNVKEKKLYSIKVQGVLRPLTLRKLYWIQGIPHNIKNYQISVNGRKIQYRLDELIKLKIPSENELVDFAKEA